MRSHLATLVEFSRKARHEGLLSLESEVVGLDDQFMRRGLQLAIDGNDPDAVAQVMRTDIRAMKARHKVPADWCQTFGIFAPTFGIIGAVIGLIATLGELDEPEKLGAGIAAAFVATFLGVFLANGVMLPLANRMKRLSAQEVQGREMVLEGVIAIQGGQNPRVIEETLMSYLSPSEGCRDPVVVRWVTPAGRTVITITGHEEHEEHVNHEAWVIPYADMLTLLMALFLVLFAIGRTDTEKFKALAESFRKEFGNTSGQVVALGEGGDNPLGGGNGILDTSGAAVPVPTTSPGDAALEADERERTAARVERNSLEAVEETLAAEAAALGIEDDLGFDLQPRGLVITVVTDQVLFGSGQADLQPEGLSILDLVAVALSTIPNDIAIEGHTDSRPISNARYRSNWELSTARATSVLQFLLETGLLDPARLSAAGYADTRPIDTNDTELGAARNRRVEIVVLAEVSLAPVLDELPADPGIEPGVVPDVAPVIEPSVTLGTSNVPDPGADASGAGL